MRTAADRCLDFLARQIDDRGRHKELPDDADLHYKLPYVFNYGGRRDLALRVLDHLETNLIEEDGYFRDAGPDAPSTQYLYSGGWDPSTHFTYASGWLAWSSAAMGRFDLARLFARRAMVEQDPQWGGFWRESELGRVQWLLNSSSAAAGFAAAGEVEAAKKSADYMLRLLDRQPDLTKGCYLNLGPDGEVVTALGSDPTLNFYDLDGPARPGFFTTVIAGLVWTGRQTGDSSHFNTARRYVDIVLSHRNHPERMSRASKSAWAILQLHTHRPDRAFPDYAAGVGRRLLELQMPDGSIDVSESPGFEGRVPGSRTFSATCDWVLTAIALANGGP